MRKFEEVKREHLKFPDIETKLPERSDAHSAGYDFYSKEHFILSPGEYYCTWTDVKAKMFYDNVLEIYPRSGLGSSKGIVIRNGTGIIDPSYYGCEKNDGNIGICLINTGDKIFEVNVGDRIAQGVFTRYLITDDDKFLNGVEDTKRSGGFGSSGN